MIINQLTQKWVIYFKNADGENNMGLVQSYQQLPGIIEILLRDMNATDIIIKDESLYFNNKGEPIAATTATKTDR